MKNILKLFLFLGMCNADAAARHQRRQHRQTPTILNAAYYIVHEHHVTNDVAWQCIKLGIHWGTKLNRTQCPFKEHRAADYQKQDLAVTFHGPNNQILKTITVENNQPDQIQKPLKQLDKNLKLVAARAKIVRHHKCRELKVFDAHNFEIGHILDYKGESLLREEDKTKCKHIDFSYIGMATDYTTPWYDGSEDEEEAKADF